MEKAKRKEFRKYLRPFKGLSIAFAVLSVFSLLFSVMITVMDNSFALFTGDTFWKLKNEDKNAMYYQSDFASKEEKEEYANKIAYQVEAEGATLLENKNNTLPLMNQARVSLFSTSSVNMVYGGTGSGNVDSSKAPTLKQALESSSFVVNDVLWDFYINGPGSKYVRKNSSISFGKSSISEAPYSSFTDDVISSFSSYSDAAILVLSRIGGEGADLEFTSENYLKLNDVEVELLDQILELKHNGVFKSVIILLNSSNPIQFDEMKGKDIDSILWIGGVGQVGLYAVADILSGKLNPSGSLVDTFCYDNLNSAAINYFNIHTYDAEGLNSNNNRYFVYLEGIYVGYKYYETRYTDVVENRINVGDFVYQDEVCYPFGYGKSYTDFAFSNYEVTYDDTNDVYLVSVDVKNVGTRAGKTSLQVYAQTPYGEYEIQNKVEKSSVQLVGFSKTDELQPQEKRTYLIVVNKSELASYDANGAKTYYISEGNHYLTLGSDAHRANNNILEYKKNHGIIPSTSLLDGEGDDSLVYQVHLDFDYETYSRSKKTKEKITNQFDDADINKFDQENNQVRYVTRNDWAHSIKQDISIKASEKILNGLKKTLYSSSDYETQDMPVLNQKNDVQLFDLLRKDFNDPLWEKLLENLSFEDMRKLVADSFHWTMPIRSIQAPGSRGENGPQGLTMTLFKSNTSAMAFSSEDVMAATFNKELIYKMGKCIGEDCLENKISFLYGPGNNIHRTPYGGRNFEYYSEDGYLSGIISAYEVKGIERYGVGVMAKHFVLNDAEEGRLGQAVWINEQALREIYLKAYQATFEESDGNGVMVSYTRLGTTWSGASKNLLTNVLRKEWGCKGCIITDNNLSDFMDPADAMIAGVSTYDAMIPLAYNELKNYRKDPVILSKMKESCHYTLYALVNSNAMNGIGPETRVVIKTPGIVALINVINILCIGVFLSSLVVTIYRRIMFKKMMM